MSRTPEEIEAELNKVRAELTQDVSDLTQLLSPAKLGETVKETVKSAGRSAWNDTKERSRAFVEKVKSGDRESIAAAAVGLSLVAGLVLLRFTRKR
ncbi:DUF3618 domain-containing protein [Buchananella felis]|uniref:DUF3618 domain-containing protein n=1 Tax=Buchananella felis TaxID=3231492 RepID=UPI00352761E9